MIKRAKEIIKEIAEIVKHEYDAVIPILRPVIIFWGTPIIICAAIVVLTTDFLCDKIKNGIEFFNKVAKRFLS